MNKIYRVAVVDGQGGGIGKTLVSKIRKELPEIDILALGTNSQATNQMIKAGATEGATGENAIVYNANKVDIIVGVLAIIISNSLLGELTPKMADAISQSNAFKILIPMNRCNVEVVGISTNSLPSLIDFVVDEIKNYIIKAVD
jgi:hypothetical protein